MPAIVAITSTSQGANYYDLFGQQYQGQDTTSAGSGFIVGQNDKELLIATNNHVIEGAKTISVQFIDEQIYEATVKGTDSSNDLAVIAVQTSKIKESTMNKIRVADLGDSSKIKVGEMAVAIGNALGYGQSVTVGYISALNRQVSVSDSESDTSYTADLIQTDAAINPGNSGGALLSANGEVIGINSNKIGGTAVEGMGYAIPITSASPIIADLMERQTRTKVAEDEVGYIGISPQEVTSQISQMYNMPEGIYVVSVEEGSAAANAGIMKGDIITKFDGSSISSYSDLQKTLQYYAAGDSVTVTVQRPQNGEYVSIELNLTLGSRPASQK